jgi:hypothetical protein
MGDLPAAVTPGDIALGGGIILIDNEFIGYESYTIDGSGNYVFSTFTVLSSDRHLRHTHRQHVLGLFQLQPVSMTRAIRSVQRSTARWLRRQQTVRSICRYAPQSTSHLRQHHRQERLVVNR